MSHRLFAKYFAALRPWLVCATLMIPSICTLAVPYCGTLQITASLPKDIQQNTSLAYKDFVKQNQYLDQISPMPNHKRKLIKTLREAIEPFGFFEAKIQLQWHKTSTCIQPRAHISLGRPTLIQAVHWQFTPKKNLRAVLGPKKKRLIYRGMIFTTQHYQHAKNHLRHRLMTMGYKDVDLSGSHIDINPDQHRANITFKVHLGQRYRFGPISWTPHLLSDDLMKRYITIRSGQDYSEEALQQLQANLQKSGYFKSVRIVYNPLKKTIVPIHIALKRGPKAQVIYGIGYDSETKTTGIFNVKINQLNPFGHVFKMQTNISKDEPSLHLEYWIPGQRPSYNNMSLQSLFKKEQLPNSVEKSTILTFKYQFHDAKTKIDSSLNYLLNTRKTTTANTTKTHLFYPSWSYAKRQNITQQLPFMTATIQQQWSVALLGSSDTLSSSLNLFQIRGQYLAKIPIHPLFRMVFATHWGINHTNDPQNQPDITKLKLGGSNGLRGYAFNSIAGPTNANKHILKAITLEAQYQMLPDLYLTTFVDAGNVTPTWHHALKKSAGVGLAYSTPLGDINVSLARPIHDGRQPWRLNLTYTT